MVEFPDARCTFFARARDYSIRVAIYAALAGLVWAPLAVFGSPAGAPAKPKAGKPGKAAKAPKDLRPELDGELKSRSKAKRRAAIRKLLRGKGRARGAEVRRAAKAERDPAIRIKLHRVMVQKADEAPDATVAALADDLLKGETVAVRASAARQLRRLHGGKVAAQALMAGLSDPDEDVRATCASALALYKARGVEKALIKAASDKSAKVRRGAALALSRRPATAAVKKALDKLEKDQDRETAEKARIWRRKFDNGKGR